MPTLPVYMDNHATTRVDPRVIEAMLPYFDQVYGNAGSVGHCFGWEAQSAVDKAREQVALSLGARPKEIVFTSGATESNNLAIKGVAARHQNKGQHLLTVTTEHKAVLDPMSRLARREFSVTHVPVKQATCGDLVNGDAGWLDINKIANEIRDDTILVSVMLANNEIGVIHQIAEIGQLCKQRGVLLHCDATQAIGKITVDVGQLNVDLMSFSAHKMYGPKGVGGLYVRRREPHVRIEAQIDGGGQEHRLRSGTLNVPGIVGLAAALRISLEEREQEQTRLTGLRDKLYQGISQSISGVTLNGPLLDAKDKDAHPLRLAGNLNLSFAGVDGEALMMSMKDLAVSSGSACTSANPEPSHVLRAIGLDDDATRSSLRFGLGRFNIREEVEYAIETVCGAVKRLRKMSTIQ